MKILISACLLGVPCRYDGKSKTCDVAKKLCEIFDLVPICPEQSGGLPTPRVPAEIRGKNIVRKDGVNVTFEYDKGARAALDVARQNGIGVALLKERSPSCGKGEVYDGTFSGTLTRGDGITAKLLTQNGIEVFGESEIDVLMDKYAK